MHERVNPFDPSHISYIRKMKYACKIKFDDHYS
jgi:hypothetical protein